MTLFPIFFLLVFCSLIPFLFPFHDLEKEREKGKAILKEREKVLLKREKQKLLLKTREKKAKKQRNSAICRCSRSIQGHENDHENMLNDESWGLFVEPRELFMEYENRMENESENSFLVSIDRAISFSLVSSRSENGNEKDLAGWRKLLYLTRSLLMR